MASPQEFVTAAVAELPEAREDVDWFDGLPYAQIGCLAEIAQRAKGDNNWTKYKQVLNLVDRFMPEADDELRNALHVSFLEHLDFIGPRGAQAWKLMTPRLQSAWKDIITYNEKLLGQPWPQGRSSLGWRRLGLGPSHRRHVEKRVSLHIAAEAEE